MSWYQDRLSPVETLIYRGDRVKIGSFECAADHPCFPVSKALDNDVFVVPRRPVWIRRDDGDYRFVGPGAILLHRAGSKLERRRVSDSGERTYWFGVHPNVFVNTLQRYRLSTHEMGGALIPDPSLRYRFAVLLKQLEGDVDVSFVLEEQVLSLFSEICEIRAGTQTDRAGPRLGTASRQRKLVDYARAYLDEHLAESAGLETVARAAGTSLHHLCRVFRSQTGITMHAYRTRQRVGKAMERLLDGDTESLTELALELGFSSHSHLCQVFQKQVGMPPSALRAPV